MPYLSVSQFKTRIGLTSTTQDSLLESYLVAASDWVDQKCGRSFAKGIKPETRTYSVQGGVVFTDDIAELVDVSVSYEVGERSHDGPVTHLYVSSPGPVEVTATFGWPSVPTAVEEATALLAHRLWKRKDTPTGTIGFEAGVSRLPWNDPDAQLLLAPYRKAVMA